MKNFNILAFIACVFLIVSCNQQSAFQYNEKVVTIQKSLLDSIEVINSDSVATEVSRLENVQALTKRKLNELVAVEAPKGGMGLKDALVSDIEALLAYNNTLFEMTKLAENDPAIIGLQDKLVTQKNVLEKCDDKLVAEQEKFAKAHSFKLENK